MDLGNQERAVLPTIINQFIDNKKSIKIGNQNTRRNLNSVFDIVRGYEHLKLKKKIFGEIINLGSQFELSVKDIIKIIEKLEKKYKNNYRKEKSKA